MANKSDDMQRGFPRFYPVMPDLAWVERLAPLGIEVIQLRLKDASPDEIERQIKGALKVCNDYDVQLIVNDYWQEAIRLGADYIHLGQEDIAEADVPAIKKAGVKFGVSSHSLEELEFALSYQPDYIALGPVYETLLKKMKWAPQGLENVQLWREKTDLPLIAIGGITPHLAGLVLEAGADSVAVVTDVITAPVPEARVREWLSETRSPPDSSKLAL
ncbi:MAG: thiamine-phosphate synthase [Rhodomicrobium sp.]|nr:MAG: thiamine-phosphate synthase [Rhodomicrobium sp.]